MILCRRPVLICDTDLYGAAALLLLAIGAWFLVVTPWQRVWENYRTTATEHTQATARLNEARTSLQEREGELARLEQVVATQTGAVPRAASLSQLLHEMTVIAAQTELELLSVAPQPAVREGRYLVNEISVTGRGRSLDFVRFLDQFAQHNPYQSLQQCALTRAAEAADSICELSWSVRLYLTPSDAAVAPAARPGGSS